MKVVKLLFGDYFEVVNYFSTSFQLQQKLKYKLKFRFIDIVWLPHSSFLLSQWFSCTRNCANANSLFQL